MTIPGNSNHDVWRPHVTVACVVTDGDRYLMVEEEVNGGIAYNQPAGHLDDGEGLQQAALRETHEETGWTVALTHFVGVHQWRSTEHGDVIVRFTFAAKPLTHDTGVRRALWLTRREIAALGTRLRSPMVLMSIDDWLAGQRLPLSVVASLMPGGAAP
jgi:8-oxo-dGTP pyrophosphatase MutT (NUDIX family)